MSAMMNSYFGGCGTLPAYSELSSETPLSALRAFASHVARGRMAAEKAAAERARLETERRMAAEDAEKASLEAETVKAATGRARERAAGAR